MTISNKSWPERLDHATQIKWTPTALSWLVPILQDAQLVADQLAPEPQPALEIPIHFYPH